MSKKEKVAPEEEKKVYEEPVMEESKPEILKESEKKPNLMYVGTTIPNVVRHSTVYAEGVLTPVIEKCIEDYPAMARLFVPVEDIVDALKEVRKEFSPLSVINIEAANKFTRRK